MKSTSSKTTPRRKDPELTLKKLRSSISNGSTTLSGVDHRSATMRRLKDLITDQVSDLGGADALSTAEVALVRRAAMLTLQTELMESRWQANDGEASAQQLECYQRTANTLRRLLESLGLERRSRDVTPRVLGDKEITALAQAIMNADESKAPA
jgi:hypothetical protein